MLTNGGSREATPRQHARCLCSYPELSSVLLGLLGSDSGVQGNTGPLTAPPFSFPPWDVSAPPELVLVLRPQV